MQEYLAILLFISIILTAVFHLVKDRIPLQSRVVYITVGVSFILGTLFPYLISNIALGGALAIYFILVICSGTALSYFDGKISLNISCAPAKVVEPETEGSSEGNPVDESFSLQQGDLAASQVCAAVDYQPADEPQALGHPGKEPPVEQGAFPPLSETISDIPLTTSVDEFEDEEEEILDFEVGQLPAESVEPDAAGKVETVQEGYSINTEGELRQIVEMIETDAVEDKQALPAGDHELETPPELLDSTAGYGQISPEPLEASGIEDFDTQTSDGDREQVQKPEAEAVEIVPATVNELISQGFKAKAAGDPAGVLNYFFTALGMCRDNQVLAGLALEISAAYQELGHYEQAVMFLSTFVEQKNTVKDPVLYQKIRNHIVYLETLSELLTNAKMPNAPNSKIPNLIKIKANLVTAERLK